ncbi:54S ribosomal protein L2 mitochondrial [Podospora pseudoanserina]|uniref:Large ribosomal subunit protein bL27m n=1 Tax=Podospora pseudoanserina TaxID=2609844 RepID=A0ABR0IF81_9PEZI|nr:54S ribosomal protein L2 mitochondrial [Podospora pseudoanserina]
MSFVQLQRPLQRGAAASLRGTTATTTVAGLEERFTRLRITLQQTNAALQGTRYASVKSQGAYRIPNKKTIAKKMGAKKTGDQYVIPGNIIYKQRGTIWHPGENTILGRDHTIHAAVAGYVKYYRDPTRHPTRQYIGVTFNREDKLPYPPGAPRRRKLGLVAVPRKTEEAPATPDALSPSGIPLAVTRLPQIEMPEETAPESVEAAVREPKKTPLEDGNSIISALIKDKLHKRRLQQAAAEKEKERLKKEAEIRMNTRVLRLQDDYSYRESNWEIGRLVGDVGTIPGSEKMDSRRAKFRLRRRKRMCSFNAIKKRKAAKAQLREEYKARVRANREKRIAERRAFAAKVKAGAAAKGGDASGKVEA